MNTIVSEFETVFLKNTNHSKQWTLIDSISIPNRAMNFGDGLFETMVFEGENIRFMDFHWARLSRGLDILRLDSAEVDLSDVLSFLQDHFSGQQLRVRWNLFRAGSGKYSPACSNTIQTLQISSFVKAPRIKKTAFISERVRLFPTAWSSCKTLNSLPYILANIERQERGMDEVILLDSRGFLSEAGSSNLFWRIGNRYFTPSLSCSCVDGVARKVILDEFQKQKIPFEVGEFLPYELEDAEQIFFSNVNGISYLECIGNHKYTIDGIFNPPL